MKKAINHYEQYIIDEDGKIFSKKSNKYLKPRIDKDGYEKVILYNQNGKKEFRVHRLVAESFLTNPNNYTIVNHKNEDRRDNRSLNLE